MIVIQTMLIFRIHHNGNMKKDTGLVNIASMEVMETLTLAQIGIIPTTITKGLSQETSKEMHIASVMYLCILHKPLQNVQQIAL